MNSRNEGRAGTSGVSLPDLAAIGATDRTSLVGQVNEMLAAGKIAEEFPLQDLLNGYPTADSEFTASEIALSIDHTLLKPQATQTMVTVLLNEAAEWGFKAVCVNPCWVEFAADRLRQTEVAVCTVVGFPLGSTATPIKAAETRQAIADGAGEIDMVINVGRLKGGDEDFVRKDMQAVTEVCAEAGVLSKVIIETALLTWAEKINACRLAVEAGVDFVKTSTGFAGGGATAEDVFLMALMTSAANLGVKASGGVRSLGEAKTMLRCGATRIGTSSGVAIMNEAGT